MSHGRDIRPASAGSAAAAIRAVARLLLWVGLGATAASSPPLIAQSETTADRQADPRTLFAHRAPLSAAGADAGDLVRLPLATEVLRACRADLSDLRVFDGSRALPFVLRRSTEAIRVLREPAVVRSATRSSAGPATGAAPQTQTESYTLDAPSAWSESGEWTLRVAVDPSRASFARDVELGWGDGTDFEVQQRSTIFRLGSGVELDEVALPPRSGPHLGVRLVGQDSAQTLDPLEPDFVFQRTERTDEGARTLDLALDLEPHPEDREEFVVETQLAAGVLAEALRFETTTRTLRRRVTVTEIGADGSEQLLGQGWIQRVGTRDSSDSASMTVALPAASRQVSPSDGSRRLRIAIDGGDSPPLEDLEIFAQMTRPEIVFEWPAAAAPHLYFGGGRARPPRFDLQQAADRRHFPRESSDATWSLLTDARLDKATLGEIEANPAFDDRPLLAFLQRPGRRIAVDGFRWTSDLELPAENSGLYRVALGPEPLSRIGSDFADLRFVVGARGGAAPGDEEAAQWPYLVAPADDWSLDLEVGGSEASAERTSRIELRLPESIGSLRVDGALRPRTLELTFGQPFFDRQLRLHVVADDERTQLFEGRVTTGRARDVFFSRRTTSRATFDVSSWADREDSYGSARASHEVTGFVVEIDDGDDAPSELRSARLAGPGRQALLVAEPGPVRAIFGATGAENFEAPTYELQRARDLVQSLRGLEVELDPPAANTEARRPGLLQQLAGDWQSLLLWTAILLSVLALGWITLRSVRA